MCSNLLPLDSKNINEGINIVEFMEHTVFHKTTSSGAGKYNNVLDKQCAVLIDSSVEQE